MTSFLCHVRGEQHGNFKFCPRLHAKLGQDERLGALKRLDEQARRLERLAAGPSVPALIALERQRSASYGGRSVLGWERNQAPAKIGNIEGR
jgi:hypothetical protein